MEALNYLFILYPNFPDGFDLKSRKDPDQCSKQLYDDLHRIFFNKEQMDRIKLNSIENKCQNFGNGDFYTLFAYDDTETYLLSSDYIGASVNWAIESKLSYKEIIEYLTISRTIGGHIVFPRGEKPTVNTARGGAGGYYDRFDLTLFALKTWYSEEPHPATKIENVIEKFESWFSLFENFDNFVSFFKLEGFLSKEGEIIDLVNSDLEKDSVIPLKKEEIFIPEDSDGYKKYFNNSHIIIKDRTEKLISI